MEIVEVRFLKGKNRRFSVPLKDDRGRRDGYPDVPAYLRSTGQVDCWCEEIPQKEFEESKCVINILTNSDSTGEQFRQ